MLADSGRSSDGCVAEPGGPSPVVITGEDWLDAICPFLRARDGSWRSASPAREHRCWAAEPPSELAVLTQQRLCLVRAHDGCERFLHARELRSSALARDRQAARGGVPVARRRARPRGRRADGLRASVESWVAQVLALPSVVRVAVTGLGVALVLLLVVLLSGGDGPDSPVTSPGPSLVGEPRSSFEIGSSFGPDGMRRYRVRQGDTLRTIADRFGISVRQLRNANDLGDPPRLEPGDVILVPVPS